MKKITFLMLHLNYGGIERQVTTLANELCKNYNVEIISLYDLLNGRSFYNLDDRINVKFIFNFGPNKKELLKNLKSLKLVSFFKELSKSCNILYTKYIGLKKVIDELKTDILISSRIEFSSQIHRKDIITISQEHSFINSDTYKIKCKKAFKDIKYLVVMTNQAKKLYESWFRDINNYTKVVVIPNMINENKSGKYSNLENNQIISVGRLEEVKDFKSLILNFSVISKSHEGLVLKIVGDGSQREELKKLIDYHNLQGKVVLTGTLNEKQINDELLKSDVFTLTSKSESFSLVLCEAMNYGLPCVAFDVDVGPREIISDNIDGFLVPKDDITKFAKYLEILLNDVNKRKKMGKNAINKAKKFLPENIINMWESIF